ncbi:DUF4166 domain-containing protein [Arthrobacter gandavensis]|uniref:DUF4166 domain-containing protein n=1 Tax=Arthrobacter gandavensis TaxID=169960 RepID=UPI0018909063|nr:DUF4166 domain-containing protein [Arthrobacter gandavensis]MBF4993690.1 DUF4166 domain-containing protein [Arthrobacter gandavensis]
MSDGSVYQRALGAAFGRLQPQLQDYFSLQPGEGRYGFGTGIFDVAGSPRPALRPFLSAIPVANAFFPEFGRHVPFTISNYPHLDPFGRSSLTAVRTFKFDRADRIFEDTTSLTSPTGLTDYVGRRRNLATDLDLSVSRDGRLHMHSPHTRLFLGRLRIPVPVLAGADAHAEQWWDETAGHFRIRTIVRQRQFGTVFVYDGSFTYEYREFDGVLPPDAEPEKWERRL